MRDRSSAVYVSAENGTSLLMGHVLWVTFYGSEVLGQASAVNLSPWRCRCAARARTERAATAPTCNGRQRPVVWSPLSPHPCVKSRSKRPGSFGRIYARERQSPSMSPRLRGQQAACSQGMPIASFVVAATTWSYAGLACLASTECEKIQAPSRVRFSRCHSIASSRRARPCARSTCSPFVRGAGWRRH